MSGSSAGRVDEVLETFLAHQPAGGDDERRVVDAELAPDGRSRLGIGLKRAASTPYGTVSIRSARAPSAIARVRRSSLHAVTQPARANAARAARRAMPLRSATNTSDPCRLTTSGSDALRVRGDHAARE